MKRFAMILLFTAFGLCACQPPPAETQTATQAAEQPGLIIDSPTINIGVSRESCTSMEVQAGTEIAWTNEDTVTLPVQVKQLDEAGNETDISASEIGPGDQFSTQLQETGTYRFYCSEDVYGTIIVK